MINLPGAPGRRRDGRRVTHGCSPPAPLGSKWVPVDELQAWHRAVLPILGSFPTQAVPKNSVLSLALTRPRTAGPRCTLLAPTWARLLLSASYAIPSSPQPFYFRVSIFLVEITSNLTGLFRPARGDSSCRKPPNPPQAGQPLPGRRWGLAPPALPPSLAAHRVHGAAARPCRGAAAPQPPGSFSSLCLCCASSPIVSSLEVSRFL